MATATLEGDVPVTAGHRLGRLASRPHAPRHQGSPGRVALGVTAERDTLAIVPPSYRPDHPAPLLVVLHGAGGDGRSALGLLEHVADRTGAIVLAPSSRDRTWDIIVGHVGPDVALIDRSLAETFDRWAVDPAHVVLAGFSDGASYALTIGLANGSLFRNVLALSPGFCAPPAHDGRPRVFVSHGANDTVLPVRSCSRRLVPQLRTQGYEVTYVEFPDGHVVPPDVIDRALGFLGLPAKRSR